MPQGPGLTARWAKRIVSHSNDGAVDVFSKTFTNLKGEPCLVTLLADGGASKLIICVAHPDRREGGRKENRYVSVLGASIMDEVARAWLAYREQE